MLHNFLVLGSSPLLLYLCYFFYSRTWVMIFFIFIHFMSFVILALIVRVIKMNYLKYNIMPTRLMTTQNVQYSYPIGL